MLVVAYNQVLLENRPKKEKTQEENWKDIYSQPVLFDEEPSGFTALVEDEERMDIIGQNGNDGLHYDIKEPDIEPREENDPNPQPTAKGGVRIK